MNELVAQRMKRISALFQQCASVADEQPNDNLLKEFLETTDSEFRSVAYEASAMSRAISDFSDNQKLEHWSAFLHQFPQHATQIHIGLGWAFSQKKVSPSSFFSIISPIMLPRVLDGLGYCDASFRQRVVIQQKVVPENFTTALLRGYDQGVGRALWYIAKGNPTKLGELISLFPEERKNNLWRGAGIAVAYVGGGDEELLDELQTQSALFFDDLKIGIILATSSRAHAGTITDSIELVCKHWFGNSAESIAKLAQKEETAATNYFDYIAAIRPFVSLLAK